MFDRSKLPILTVDACVFDTRGALLLIRRARPPFEGLWALPGGLVDPGETVESAVVRELQEETNFSRQWGENDTLRLLRLYSQPGRDPRGDYISAAFFGMVPVNINVTGGDDASHAEWVMDWEKEKMAFDHGQIARDAWAVLDVEKGITGPAATLEELEKTLLSPRQRAELKAIYEGKGSGMWRASYNILEQRGLIRRQQLSTGQLFFTLTRKGMDVLTYKPETLA